MARIKAGSGLMTIANKKAPAATGASKSTLTSKLDSNPSKPTTKRHTILLALAQGRKLTRFTAEHLRDHCLNTTVSEIGRYDKIIVSRKRISFTNSAGHSVSCNLYWLEPDQQGKAMKILGLAI